MDELINCRALPPGFTTNLAEGLAQRAFYKLSPYPYYGFIKWKTEELGDYPVCLPVQRAVINRSAVWLFGKKIEFYFLGDDEIQKALKEIWDLNNFDTKLVPMGKQGGKEGGVSIKFSYDSTSDCPVRLQVLSNLTDVKYFYDPVDAETVVMVRVQYPIFKANENRWYWYREEWTKKWEVHYELVEIDAFGVSRNNPYEYTGSPVFPTIDTTVVWTIKSQKANKFGLIPIKKINNIEEGTQWGSGDCFGLTKVLDRINLAYWLMDRDNQLSVSPDILFIDLEPKDGDSLDQPISPMGIRDMQSTVDEESTPKQGKAQILEAQSKIREHLTKYANDLKQMLYDTTGSVFPRQEDITNKGSLTQSVLIQMYAPLLEITNEKRKSYGENGIIPVLKMIVLALANLGIAPFNKVKGVTSLADSKLDTKITWFSQFEASEDELFAAFDRLDREASGGYIPVEIAVTKVAQLEEIVLTENQIKEQTELVNVRIRAELDQLSNQSPTGPNGKSGAGGKTPSKNRGNDPGGNEKGQGTIKSRQQKRGASTKDAS